MSTHFPAGSTYPFYDDVPAVMPTPLYNGTLSGRGFEAAERLRQLSVTFNFAMGFPIVPILVPTIGDEQPFRTAPPLNEQDAENGTICTKSGKWVPAHRIVIVDGKAYDRRYAPVSRYREETARAY